MRRRFFLIVTSIYLTSFGLLLSFFPLELTLFFDVASGPILTIALQLIGALYLGFGVMNWLARKSPIGGIYNRPLVFGNLLHFLMGAFAILKQADQFEGNQFMAILSICTVYFILAMVFGYFLRKSPKMKIGEN